MHYRSADAKIQMLMAEPFQAHKVVARVMQTWMSAQHFYLQMQASSILFKFAQKGGAPIMHSWGFKQEDGRF